MLVTRIFRHVFLTWLWRCVVGAQTLVLGAGHVVTDFASW